MGNDQSRQERRSNPREGVSQRELEIILEQQRIMYELQQKQILESLSSKIKQNQPSQSTSFERNRTPAPYSYTKEALQNTGGECSKLELYPNLNNVTNVGIQPCNTVPSSIVHNNNASNIPGARNNDEGFVFINNNKQQAQRFTPTAPPASMVNHPTSRARSVPSPKTSKGDDELNCPTCKKRFGTTIFQCRNGHSSCQECKLRAAYCALCRYPITDMRNITLEAYISEIKAPCPNANDGCSLHFKLGDMALHTKECPFSEMACPLVDIYSTSYCSWRGKLSEMGSHFDLMHPANVAYVDKEMALFNIKNIDNHTIYFVNIGAFNFLVHVKVAAHIEKKIYMTVQFLGTKVSATKWSYEIDVYNKSEPRRKFNYTDICHSTSTAFQDIYKTSQCAAVPLDYLKTFIQNNENVLNYKLFIKRNDEGKKEETRGNYRSRGARRKYQ